MKFAALHRQQKYAVRPIPGKYSFNYAELLIKSLITLNFHKTYF